MPNVGKLSQPKPKKKKKPSLRARAKGAYTKYKIGKGRKAGKKAAEQTKGMGGFESGGSLTKVKPHKLTLREKAKKAASKVKLTGRPKTKTYREKNVGVEKTKGGKYPTYKKGGKAAGSFKSTFAAKCKDGATGFTWQGRKYSCAKK